MELKEYISLAASIYKPYKDYNVLPADVRYKLGKLFLQARETGITTKDISEPIGINRRTANDMIKYFEKQDAPPETTAAPTKQIKVKQQKVKTLKQFNVKPLKRETEKQIKITVYLSNEQHRNFKVYAALQGETMNKIINEFIEKVIKK